MTGAGEGVADALGGIVGALVVAVATLSLHLDVADFGLVGGIAIDQSQTAIDREVGV